MPRSVNSVASRARKKRTLKLAKGYFGRRKNVWTVAKNAVEKARCYARRDSKQRGRQFRRLWIQRINAAARDNGTNYSRLMFVLKQKGCVINRKMLACLAMNNVEAIKKLINLK